MQEPFNTQSLNRYSYGFNNPLNGTDPSGYSFFKKVAGIIVGAVGTYLCGPTCGAWGYAAIGAAAFNGIGDIFAGCTSCAGDFVGSGMNALAFSGKVLAHGLVGGAGSVLRGGKFGHGFASAGLTQSFASKIGGIASRARFSVGRIAAAAIVGGTASRLSGGKFANGATTGAFSRLFDDEAHYRNAQKGAAAASNAVKTKLMKYAEENPDAVIPLTMGDIDAVTNHMRYEVQGEPKHWFMSDEYKTQFAGLDTFFYRAQNLSGEKVLVGRQFSLEGRTYYGGEINYIGVGMLAAHYGGVTRLLLNPMVARWNYNQYKAGEGDHNLRQIYGESMGKIRCI